jgi:hypothetical protein
MPALILAGSGADPPENSGEDISDAVDFVRASVPLFEEAADIGGNVGIGRAGPLAGDIDVYVVKVFRLGRVDDTFSHFSLAIEFPYLINQLNPLPFGNGTVRGIPIVSIDLSPAHLCRSSPQRPQRLVFFV